MFLVLLVGLSVCLCVGLLKSNKPIWIKFLPEVCLKPRKKYQDFRDDLNYHTNPGVHITKNPNFDPISTFSYFHYKS